jgi:hypothetical protein
MISGPGVVSPSVLAQLGGEQNHQWIEEQDEQR